MDHQHFEDMVPLYAVGGMDPHERQEFEEHLHTGCAVCQGLLKDFQETLSLLPYGLPHAEVPPHLKSQLLEKISEGTRREDRHQALAQKAGFLRWIGAMFSPRMLRPLFTVMLFLIIAGIGFYASSLQSQLEEERVRREEVTQVLDETIAKLTLLRQQVTAQEHMVRDLRDRQNQKQTDVALLHDQVNRGKAQLEELRGQLTERTEETEFLRRALEQKDMVVRLLLSPNVVVVSLEGIEQSPGSAFLLFDPQRGNGLFYSFNLPALPRGKVYQLWAIVDKPQSLGTFGLDRGRKGRMLIKRLANFSSISKFAVSIEPDGGRPQPTGTIHLMGET